MKYELISQLRKLDHYLFLKWYWAMMNDNKQMKHFWFSLERLTYKF